MESIPDDEMQPEYEDIYGFIQCLGVPSTPLFGPLK
jgi:hypothetical protein